MTIKVEMTSMVTITMDASDADALLIAAEWGEYYVKNEHNKKALSEFCRAMIDAGVR